MVEQTQVTQSSSVNPVLMQTGANAEFLKYRTDTSDILNNLYKFISAVEWDSRNKKWIRVPNREPLANDAFINLLMGILWTFMNRNTIHANISDKDVHDIVFSVCEEIVWFIVESSDVYGIKEENCGLIMRMIENCLLLTLSRAKDDGERQHESMSYKNNETTASRLVESGGSKLWGR